MKQRRCCAKNIFINNVCEKYTVFGKVLVLCSIRAYIARFLRIACPADFNRQIYHESCSEHAICSYIL